MDESNPNNEINAAVPASNPSAFSSDALFEVLATRDAQCPVCKYNLRQLRQPRCPECGRSLELSVRATDVPVAAWITSLVALLPAAPFGVLFLIFMGEEAHWGFADFRTAGEQWGLVLGLYAIMAVPGSIFLLISRRRFAQWQPRWQAVFVAVPIAFDVAALITLLGLIRL